MKFRLRSYHDEGYALRRWLEEKFGKEFDAWRVTDTTHIPARETKNGSSYGEYEILFYDPAHETFCQLLAAGDFLTIKDLKNES